MTPKKADTSDRLKHYYIKSGQFRVIHVDGAFGGFGPRQFVNMALFSERKPIPKMTANRIDQDAEVVAEEMVDERDCLDGLVREIECNLVFDIPTALAVRDWLDNKIKEALKSDLFKKGEPSEEKH